MVVHRASDGSIEVLPAERDPSGAFVIDSRSFSVNGPGWVDPTALWRFLGQKIASGIGGRTEALACPKDSPKWFR